MSSAGRYEQDPVGLFRRIPLAPHEMTARTTALRDFFTLVHLGVPHIDATRWNLQIDGMVERPCRFSFQDIAAMPKQVLPAVHQCAGNPLEPRAPTRRVASVEWGGVSLASLLDQAGIRPDARFVWSFGADYGNFAGYPCEAFGKDLPIARIAAGDVLVAYEINGEPLPRENGFPARLVVPGFYGTNSVKWLSRIELADRRLDNLFTTVFYNDAGEGEQIRPVWSIPVEAIIVSPAPGAVVEPGVPLEIWGWAWAEAGVCGVEVQCSDDAIWMPAEIEPRRNWSWQRFRILWRPPGRAGGVTLAVRALSSDGRVQPASDARNAIHTVDVMVACGDGKGQNHD